MKIKVNKTLNRNFEILGLLYMSNNMEHIEKAHYVESVKEQDMNIDGAKLYDKFGGVLKRYVKTFKKNMILTEEEKEFFKENSGDAAESIMILLQFAFGENPNWVEGIKNIPEAELRRELIAIIFEEYDSDDVTELLKVTGLPAEICWEITLMFQDPKAYIAKVSRMIKKNISAYKKAIAAVEKPLDKLLNKFGSMEYKVYSALEDGASVTPILIHPAVELINDLESTAYIGLYLDEVYKMLDKTKSTRDSITPALKALSDNSKFEILTLLKKAPMYNLELAEELGLTAATVSHHMNALLTHDLVSVSKHDGRVYYSINKEALENVMTQIKDSLLI